MYIDAGKLLPHIPKSTRPALSARSLSWRGALGGDRFCDVRSPTRRQREPAALELVRLAFPRRMYTQSHVDYLAEVLLHVAEVKESIRGVRIVQAPRCCATSARFELVGGALIV